MQQQFWWIQSLGWLGYFCVVYISVVAPVLGGGNELERISHLFIETASGFICSLMLWKIVQRIEKLKTRVIIIICGVLAVLLSLLFNFVKIFSFKFIESGKPWAHWSWLEFGGWYLFSFTTILVWTALWFILIYNKRLESEHNKALRAEALAAESKLKMLRYQLNPHFMFNSMNAISTLILKKDNETANDMLEKLCDFFRYTLDEKSYSKITLASELELLKLYIQIEKIRFGERLRYEEHISEGIHSALVPSFFLQPLVENSIKYAVSSRKDGGTIRLSAEKVKDKLVINVNDEGLGEKEASYFKEPSLGIGLSNIKERLSQLYGSQCKLKMKPNSANGLNIKLTIPLEMK